MDIQSTFCSASINFSPPDRLTYPLLITRDAGFYYIELPNDLAHHLDLPDDAFAILEEDESFRTESENPAVHMIAEKVIKILKTG